MNLAAVPIIGEVIEKALDFANKRWGYNKTEQDIKKTSQEILENTNIRDMIQSFWNFLIEYEGKPDLFVQLGPVGKILAFLRIGWRPTLQWGLTIDILRDVLWNGIPIMQMKEEIIFVGSLAVLREIGKKFGNKE